MSKVVLDTNAFLRILLNDIPTQADRIGELFEQGKKKQKILIVPQIIIFEITFALNKYYHFSKEETVEKLKSILTASYLRIQNREIHKRAIEIFERENISLTDCFLFFYAKKKNAELFTFDQQLKKLL